MQLLAGARHGGSILAALKTGGGCGEVERRHVGRIRAHELPARGCQTLLRDEERYIVRNRFIHEVGEDGVVETQPPVAHAVGGNRHAPIFALPGRSVFAAVRAVRGGEASVRQFPFGHFYLGLFIVRPHARQHGTARRDQRRTGDVYKLLLHFHSYFSLNDILLYHKFRPRA